MDQGFVSAGNFLHRGETEEKANKQKKSNKDSFLLPYTF